MKYLKLIIWLFWH